VQDGGVIRELRAVLFDMDGTLIDSEKVWEVALNDLAELWGGRLSHEARISMVGASSETTMEIMLADLDQPWRNRQEGADWLDQRAAELFESGLEWRPGAKELLAEVRAAGLKLALVTNTNRPLVEVALGTLGRDTFDLIVCGDEVTHPKPHPEPYLTAAARLGVSPRQCVVVEDSPAGMASGIAAGCHVLAVPAEIPLTTVNATVLDSLVEVTVPFLRALVTEAAPAVAPS
jgi:HAD superfamily hydrolase (TIGR01509 family)